MNSSGYNSFYVASTKLCFNLSLVVGLIGLWLLLSLSGCSDEIATDRIELQQEISISGTIEQQNKTRVSDGGFVVGDQIGVYVVDYQDGNSGTLMLRGNRANNYALTLNATSERWEGNGAIYWKDNQTAIDIYGYYPYDNGMESVDEHIFTIQVDQSEKGGNGTISGYERSDFLWAKKTNVHPTSELIELNFEHRMAGVKVLLQQGDGFVGEEWNKLKRVVTIENTILSAHINMGNGVVTPLEADGRSIIAASQGDDIYRAVAIPQIVSGDKAIIGMTIDGISYKYVRGEDIKLRQGKMHTFTLKVDKKDGGDYQLSLENEGIEPWENDKSSHNFEAAAYTIIQCLEEGTLEGCIGRTGKNPQEIVNLKIIGKLNDSDFFYIRNSLSQLRALNVYETTISKNVLPDNALYRMTNLNHLVLPKQLETIGSYALSGIGLAHNSTLVIPDGVKVLENHCLYEISQGNLILPDSLEYIGFAALAQNQCAFKIPLSNNVKYIGDCAFSHYNESKSHSSGHFRLPEFIEYIGEECFVDYGEGIEGEINIPSTMTAIPFATFQSMNFANGTSLTLHDKVVRIEARAFSENQFNNKIVWPAGLISIGDEAFSSCNFRGGMENLPDGLSNLGKDAFAYSKNLPENLNLPLYLSRVSSSSFAFTNIRTLNILGYTECIEAESFAYCEDLTTVKFGKYVESIGSRAFIECRSLRNITILNPEPPTIESDAFAWCDKDHIILEVPEQSVSKYRNATGWSDFKYITAYHELAVNVGHISCLDKGISRSLVIRSEGEWEVTDCPTWCHLSQRASDVRTTEITISVDASAYPREGEIVFSLKNSGYKTTCQVFQYVADEEENKEIVLQGATEGNRAIPLFIVGEGFTAQHIADGTYMETIRKRMEEFFAIEPYKTYRNYFTVTTALAVSPEEGISSVQTPVVNKFNTIDDPSDGYRCDYHALQQYVKDVSAVISDANINNSLILVAINQNTFNGKVQIFDDGLTVSFIPESPFDYPYNTRGLVQYYAGGQGFGRLADESISHQEFIRACTCPFCNRMSEYYAGLAKGWYGNISLTAAMKTVPWSHLIFDSHYSDVVDVFEGGLYHARGVFRSESQSCMSTFIQYYNTISRELIVRRIMELTGEAYSFEKFISRDSREGLPQ